MAKLYKGKIFAVTIDRSQAERRYVLKIWDDEGQMIPQNEPLKFDEFREHYGFSETWPHDEISTK